MWLKAQNYNIKYATFVREFVNHSTIYNFDFILFYNRTDSESLK